MTMTILNNRPERKQLSDQLDRLDSILDGLSNALGEAVADASREGVRLAVKEAVIELLTNPDLRTSLHQASTPKAAPTASFWGRIKQRILQAATRAATTVRSLVAAARRRVVSVARSFARRIVPSRRFRAASRVVRFCFAVAVTVSLLSRGLVTRVERLFFAAVKLFHAVMERVTLWRGSRLGPQTA